MPPNPHDTSAETCVFVFKAVCNLGFSIKYFLAQLFLTSPLPQGLKGMFVSTYSYSSLSPVSNPAASSGMAEFSLLGPPSSVESSGVVPFPPCPPSCRLSPPHPQHWAQGRACTCLFSAVEVRSGFVFSLCFLSTALINVLSLWQVWSLSSTKWVHSVTQFWRGMLFDPVLLGRPGVLSINSLRLLHQEQ